VAVSESTAVVGAWKDDVGANFDDQGSAYVFIRSGGAWTQEAKLVAAEGALEDFFGYSVAVSGDTAIVGAYLDDVGANVDQGSATVFTRSGNTWGLQAQLLAGDGAAGDYFGISVAVDGDMAVVGALGDDVGANQGQGSATVYTRSGAVWSSQAQLVAADGAPGAQFGRSVGVHGDTVVVGAPYHDEGAEFDQGAAYVLTRSGAAWNQQKLLAWDGASTDLFGNSVAVNGDTVLVGALFDGIGANSSQGSAHVFVRTGGSWSEQAQLLAADGSVGDLFGISVAVYGDTAAVGADGANVGTNTNQGAAYLFTRNGGTWGQKARLWPQGGAEDDSFGISVALSPGIAVVGATQHDTVAGNQGAAYTFEFSPLTPEHFAVRVVSASRVELSWVDCSGLEDGFDVQFTTSSGRGNTFQYAGVNLTGAALDGLLPSTAYAFRVRAYNTSQDGAWSDWVVATTLPAAPPLPAAPSGLYVTASVANELLLRWTDNANNEADFILQRSTDRVNFTQILDGTSNTISFPDTGLTPGATYYYRVCAYNEGGTSAWSEIASGRVWRSVPPTPLQLRAMLNPNGGIVVLWKDGANENLYRVEAKLNAGSFSEIGQTGTDVTTFIHAGLSPDQTWTYRVRASNEAGNSPFSTETVIKTNPPAPPAPSNLQASALSNRVVSVTWTDNSSNENEFRLERKTATTSYAQIAIITANGTAYFDNAVAPSTTYTYRIRAANAGGTSVYSSPSSGATPAGVTEGELQVRPTAIRFRGVKPGESAVQKLTIVNAGKGNLKVVVAQLSAPFTVLGTRTFTLKKKAQQTLTVRYDANAQSKGSSTTLGIAGSGRKHPVVYVPVTAD
jgi:hypothetical protein